MGAHRNVFEDNRIVDNCVLAELVPIAQPLGVEIASPSMATEFSSDEPSAKPACHSLLTSLTKPNVRARAISRRKVAGSRLKARR